MAENTTTLLEKWQKQQQEHPDWAPTLEDLLYIIHGTGSDRDRIYSIEEVRNLIQSLFTSLHVTNNGVAETNITPGTVSTYGGVGIKARVQGGLLLNITGNGIFLYASDEETLLGSLVWDSDAAAFKFTSNMKIDAGKYAESDDFKCGRWNLLKDSNADLHLKETDSNVTTTCVKFVKGGSSGGRVEVLRPIKHERPVTFSKGAVLPRVVTGENISFDDSQYSVSEGYPVGSVIVVENNGPSPIDVGLTSYDFETIPINSSQMFYRRSSGGGDGSLVDSGWIVLGRRFTET